MTALLDQGLHRPLEDLLERWEQEAADRRRASEVQADELSPAEREKALEDLHRDRDWGDQPNWRRADREGQG